MNDQKGNETKNDKVNGFFMGIPAGIITAIIFILVGFLLCLTGIGAIIGVPLIIGGIASPFIGPVAVGLTSIKGKCPYCESEVQASSMDKGVTCPACKKRIVIRDKKFYKVE
jgi:DNA-directed RNA polymerase subunit RPC12/RpoP